MIKVGLIGAGKMGLSHLAILGAHPEVEIVGVSDTSSIVINSLKKYSPFRCFTDYRLMLDVSRPEAVFVAVPTKLHATMIRELIQRKIHVFAEKPFCLNPEEGLSLVNMARENGVVNQVGYHNRFIGTFNEVKSILDRGDLGQIDHFSGEAYGPVVIKKKQDNWRSRPSEGGGCLMDYASHVIDLINFLIAPVQSVRGSLLKSIYSDSVEDAVYSLLQLQNNVSGTLMVNWSDETYRKMSTSITIYGSKGKVIADANEMKVYFKESPASESYSRGWNVRYVTDLTSPVDFNLRGEEYTAQIDHFISAVQGKAANDRNTFSTSWATDRAIDLIRKASKSN